MTLKVTKMIFTQRLAQEQHRSPHERGGCQNFENRIIEHLKDHGHVELTSAHINLTRNLDEDGTRLTELARRASLTKQSMSELVDQVERTGLIEKRPDPADGRAKLVCFHGEGIGVA
ncbi:MarR family winged helix-turn-helix transcriptional regulator [Rhizobium beringeri]